jgi:hypothetical protein
MIAKWYMRHVYTHVRTSNPTSLCPFAQTSWSKIVHRNARLLISFHPVVVFCAGYSEERGLQISKQASRLYKLQYDFSKISRCQAVADFMTELSDNTTSRSYAVNAAIGETDHHDTRQQPHNDQCGWVDCRTVVNHTLACELMGVCVMAAVLFLL